MNQVTNINKKNIIQETILGKNTRIWNIGN